jgi:hypothetical protein
MIEFIKVYHKELIIGTLIAVSIGSYIYFVSSKNSDTIYVQDQSTQTEVTPITYTTINTQTDGYIPIGPSNPELLSLKIQYNKVIEATLINYHKSVTVLQDVIKNANDPGYVVANLVELHERLNDSGMALASEIAIKAIT